MPRRTLDDLERDPKNVRYDDLVRILRENGCSIREGRKTHTIADCAGRTVTFPRHRKVVKPIYVKLAVRAIRGGDR